MNIFTIWRRTGSTNTHTNKCNFTIKHDPDHDRKKIEHKNHLVEPQAISIVPERREVIVQKKNLILKTAILHSRKGAYPVRYKTIVV